jgi:uncharacterized protein
MIPGLAGSGAEHWQTRWERRYPGHVRVQQRDWDRPELDEWLRTLSTAIEAAREPPVLVAHSLGCVLVAHASGLRPSLPVRAALLVAPADVDRCAPAMPEIQSFAPMPTEPLRFPATVVASRNDPYMFFDRARRLAETWGSGFVDAGEIGHINAESGLGDWDEGRSYLEALLERS